MKLKTRLIYSGVLTILGGILACVAGLLAEEHPIGDMPALVSIMGVMGLMSFVGGLICGALIISFGDEK